MKKNPSIIPHVLNVQNANKLTAVIGSYIMSITLLKIVKRNNFFDIILLWNISQSEKF